jgi:small basic protein (TIGR04137 family)
MSLDRSLRSANSLVRHRNVLTRAERIDRLEDNAKWTDAKSVFGLPKVGNRKQALAKAEKTEAAAAPGAAGAAAPAAGTAAPATAGSAKPAAGAKGTAPAVPAGGKAGAPAAKKK